MKKSDGNKVEQLYPPFTVINGGLCEDADTNIENNISIKPKSMGKTVYIVASPTGLCGVFTNKDFVDNYLAQHPNVTAFQVEEDKVLQ